ncbi:hypothetical protein D5086_003064 [Populus alba]|uniref:Uncharacterized protein n=1 Tax=Populus alba TaxID=43335 RepID=A0ACC4D3T4_POPAL
MAATDPQRQLLTLIRDFASEKSQGERRVVGLEKRIVELGCQLDAANAEMEEVKRFKETTELELKGYEFQLAFNDVSIQTLEARISMIQDEISSVGSEVEGLKDEEGASRDEFIRQMFELNTKIRCGGGGSSCGRETSGSGVLLGFVCGGFRKVHRTGTSKRKKDSNLKKRAALQLQQTSELEQDCASLGEQLQNRCICPICRADNVEALGGVLEANKAN